MRYLLLLLTLTLGCSSRSDSVTILVGGDTQGWITPCGCAANQSGGLTRRARLVELRQASGDTLLLDAGGSAVGTGPYQRIKLNSLLRGLQTMGLAAHNVGGPETEFAPSELNNIASKTSVNWLTTNLVARNGESVGKRSITVDRGGLNIGIVGVIEPHRVQHADWQTTDAVRSIVSEFDRLDVDVRIVLAYFDEGGLRSLAQSLPDVDLIIGGPTGQAMSPTRVGNVRLMSATNKGKFLAEVKLKSTAGEFEIESAGITEVSSKLSENAEQLDNLADYLARLKTKDFTAEEAELVSHLTIDRADYSIAGSDSCVACHQQDDAVWHNSKHSHAWEVLVARDTQFDPQCQQCHTTGYGYNGGFVNVKQSAMRTHVGCENCHGPSSAHVDNPKRKTPFNAREQCIRCHDHENSPEFDREIYWAKVTHGPPS